MTAVTLRPHAESDDPRLVEILNSVFPDRPPISVEHFRHNIELGNKHDKDYEERVSAELNGVVVGSLVLEKQWWVAGPDVWWGEILVHPDDRGQGIGRRLYEFLLERACSLGARKLYGEVQEDVPEALGFVERRGFGITGYGERLSRLDVQQANLDGYEGIEERLASEGIGVFTMADLGPDDELLRRVYETECASVKDVPSSEDHGEFWPFDLWREEMISGPGRSADSFFIAMDNGQPVGLARLKRRGENAAFNGYTGVAASHRGRGVARALKLRTIQWSRQNGVDYIYTGNDPNNARMLAINIKLGYQLLPGMIEVVKELA